MKNLILVWASFLLVPLAFAESGTVVFGSYTQPQYAQDATRKVQSELGVDAQLVAVSVNGRNYLRVISPLMDEYEARALVQKAKRAGIVGPWYLSAERLATQQVQSSTVLSGSPSLLTPREPGA